MVAFLWAQDRDGVIGKDGICHGICQTICIISGLRLKGK